MSSPRVSVQWEPCPLCLSWTSSDEQITAHRHKRANKCGVIMFPSHPDVDDWWWWRNTEGQLPTSGEAPTAGRKRGCEKQKLLVAAISILSWRLHSFIHNNLYPLWCSWLWRSKKRWSPAAISRLTLNCSSGISWSNARRPPTVSI